MKTENPTEAVAKWRLDAPSKSRVVTDDDDRITVAENLTLSDARLIASAPELLDALKKVLSEAEFLLKRDLRSEGVEFGEGSEAMKTARAVIAKATGATQKPSL